MKRNFIILMAIIIIFLTGCSNDNAQKKELLIGEWEYHVSKSGSWGDFYSYEFFEDGVVAYWECKDLQLGDEGCENGSLIWKGKYSLKDNIITMNDFEIDKTSDYKPTDLLIGPKEKMIVDFDNMYFCEREEGLDCSKKYEKYVE